MKTFQSSVCTGSALECTASWKYPELCTLFCFYMLSNVLLIEMEALQPQAAFRPTLALCEKIQPSH